MDLSNHKNLRPIEDFVLVEEPNGRQNCVAITATECSRLRRLRALRSKQRALACPAFKQWFSFK